MSGSDWVDAADSASDNSDAGGDYPWSGMGARTWVLSILVGAFFGLFEAVLGQFIGAGSAVASALEAAGSAVAAAGGDVGGVVLEALSVPFDVVAELAAGLGPLAPVAVAVAWALAAAFVGLVAYIVWRLFTWI